MHSVLDTHVYCCAT